MTTAERIRQVDADGWHWANEITAHLAAQGITGNATPAVRAYVRSLEGGDWTFNLITLADGKITAAPAEYKGTIE